MRYFQKLLVLCVLVAAAPAAFAQVEIAAAVEAGYALGLDDFAVQAAATLGYDTGSIVFEMPVKYTLTGDVWISTGLGLGYDLPLHGDRILRLSVGPRVAYAWLWEGPQFGGYLKATYKNDASSSWCLNAGLDAYYMVNGNDTLFLPMVFLGAGFSLDF